MPKCHNQNNNIAKRRKIRHSPQPPTPQDSPLHWESYDVSNRNQHTEVGEQRKSIQNLRDFEKAIDNGGATPKRNSFPMEQGSK